jgi:hypothetical protein
MAAAGRRIVLKVEIDIDNGNVITVTADNARPKDDPTLPPDRTHLGNVFWSHSSPGCVYWIGGVPVAFC